MRISPICTQEQAFPLCRRHSRRARTARHTRNTWQPRAARASRQGPLLSRFQFQVLCTRLHAQGVRAGNLTPLFAVLQALTAHRVCPAHPVSTDLPDHQAAQARTGPLPCRDRRVVMSQLVPTQLFGMQRRPITHARTAPARAHNSNTNINGTTWHARANACSTHGRISAKASMQFTVCACTGRNLCVAKSRQRQSFPLCRRSGHTWCPRCPRRPGRARPCGQEWHPRQSRPSRLAPTHAHILAQCGADSGGRTDRLLDAVALI